MIRVTVELVPFGREEEAHIISRMLIANTGAGDHITGQYASVIEVDGKVKMQMETTGFPRKDGVITLIHKVLESEQCNDSNKLIFERLKKRLV